MRSRAASPARSPKAPASSNRSLPSSAAALSTLTTRVPQNSAGGGSPTCCSRVTTRRSKAGEGSRSAEEPDRLFDRRAAARVARHDRLARDDRRRDRDRARDEGVAGEPVPDPVELDGADAALREAGRRLQAELFRSRARMPLLLPPLD